MKAYEILKNFFIVQYCFYKNGDFISAHIDASTKYSIIVPKPWNVCKCTFEKKMFFHLHT